MKTNWKKLTLIVAALGAIFMVATAEDCGGAPANSAETNQVTDQQGIYTRNQPVPTFQYSNERELLIQLYEKRTTGNLNTWTVWLSNNGVPLGMCASKGFPLPYSTELTNPHQITYQHFPGNGGAWETGVVDQMDPNGLYPNGSTLATWVMCIDNDGSVHPQYIEPLVMTYTYPIAIQDGKIVKVGNGTADSKVTITQK